MGSRVQCFVIAATLRGRASLRRYVSSEQEKCPLSQGYHNAQTPIGERALRVEDSGCYALVDRSEPSHEDPRWPRTCACGFAFRDSDPWQLFYEIIYARADNGAEMTLREATPGAMWDCTWWPDKAADGHHWCVKLPPGGPCDEWQIDGPSKNGGGWTRTGEAPRLTARPSILTDRYHGFLTDGWLVEC